MTMTATQAQRNPKFVWQSAFIESGITGNAGFIGLVMSTYDNGDGKGHWISQETISTKTGLSIETVRRSIKLLIETGWIERTSIGRAGRASTYRLSVPEPNSSVGLKGSPNRASENDNRAAATGSTGQQRPPIRQPLRPSLVDQDEYLSVVDNRSDMEKRRRFEQDNEAEGFDRNGMPIESRRRSRLSDGYQRRYTSEI